MASADLKRVVAAQVALGASTAELAERFSYTPRGMRKLVGSHDVQQLVAEERTALAERVEGYKAQLLAAGEMAVENVKRVVADPRHPRNVETSRWLLDRIAYGRADGLQVQVNAFGVLTPAAAELLTARLEELQAMRARDVTPIEKSPHLIPPDGR